jgi:urease accessory protein
VKLENPAALPGAASTIAPQAEIAFSRAPSGRSYVSHGRVGYPFHLGRTLELQGDPAGMTSIYLQSCSGGLFEHERIGAHFSALPGAAAHVTTGASNIVHTMPAGEAHQTVRLTAHQGALFEYLPEPTILFPDARLKSRLSIELADDAVCIAGDALLLHDPRAGGAHFDWFDAIAEVRDADGRLLACDRQRVTGRDFSRPLPGVLGRRRAQGTLLFALRGSRIDPLLGAVREALAAVPDLYAGASRLPNGCGVWARLLAEDAIALRAGWYAAWAAARKLLTGMTPQPRRR